MVKILINPIRETINSKHRDFFFIIIFKEFLTNKVIKLSDNIIIENITLHINTENNDDGVKIDVIVAEIVNTTVVCSTLEGGGRHHQNSTYCRCSSWRLGTPDRVPY